MRFSLAPNASDSNVFLQVSHPTRTERCMRRCLIEVFTSSIHGQHSLGAIVEVQDLFNCSAGLSCLAKLELGLKDDFVLLLADAFCISSHSAYAGTVRATIAASQSFNEADLTCCIAVEISAARESFGRHKRLLPGSFCLDICSLLLLDLGRDRACRPSDHELETIVTPDSRGVACSETICHTRPEAQLTLMLRHIHWNTLI